MGNGEGAQRLDDYYRQVTGSGTPARLPLATVKPSLTAADERYLAETRPDVVGANDEYLAFYYQHMAAMQEILVAEKTAQLMSVGIAVAADIRVTASLRRPFKKGARLVGGTSRSDEIHLGGVNGFGELFLKMMHEVEDSILRDSRVSSSGLVEWNDVPSEVGNEIDLFQFFSTNPYGQINRARPATLREEGDRLTAMWRRSSELSLSRTLRIDPLWCYISGLCLAEGSTPKSSLFAMFGNSVPSLSLGFTSSEGTSIELMLRALQRIFLKKDCLSSWKVKVGSQYFPELVMTALKHGMPMLRGGDSGDGKLRTIEVSLAIQNWALEVADSPLAGTESILRADYTTRYSHVEPTGAGVARIDFSASSSICRWFFPLLMFTVFGEIVDDPTTAFY